MEVQIEDIDGSDLRFREVSYILDLASNKTSVTLDEVITEYVPFGIWHKRLFALCGLGWMCDAMWIESITLFLPRFADELELPMTMASWVATSLFAGMGIGALFWGWLADRVGRSSVFTSALIVSIAGSMVLALSFTLPWLCLSSAILGIGVGGHIVVDTMLFYEFVPRTHAHWLGWLNFFFPVGSALAALLGWLVLEYFDLSWRHIVGIMVGIESMVLLVRMLMLPLSETPKYLLETKKDPEGCFAALVGVLKFNLAHARNYVNLVNFPNLSDLFSSDSSPLYEKIKLVHDSEAASVQETPHSLATLAKQGAVFLPLCGVWFFINFGYTVFNVFLPAFLELSTSSVSPILLLVVYTGMAIPSSLLATYLLRKSCYWTLTASLALTSLFIASIPFSVDQNLLLVTALVLVSVATTIMWSGLYTWTPLLFNTKVRGLGGGICGGVGRLGGIVAPLVGGILFTTDAYDFGESLLQKPGVMCIFLGASAVGLALLIVAFLFAQRKVYL